MNSLGLGQLKFLGFDRVGQFAISAGALAKEACLRGLSVFVTVCLSKGRALLLLLSIWAPAQILEALTDYCLSVDLSAIEVHVAAPMMPLPLARFLSPGWHWFGLPG